MTELPDDLQARDANAGRQHDAVRLIASPSAQQRLVAEDWLHRHGHQNPDLECVLDFLRVGAPKLAVLATYASAPEPLHSDAIAGILVILPNGNVSLECSDRQTAVALFAQMNDLEGEIRVAISQPASQWLRPLLLRHYQLLREHWPLVMVCTRPSGSAEGRWAKMGDRPELQAYVEAYRAERGSGNTHIDWDRLIQNRRVAVIERNGQIAAAVRYVTTAHHAIVSGTFTFAPFRRQGVGRRLITFLTTELLNDYPRVKLWVDEDNVGAIALYRSVGFEPVGELYTGRFKSRHGFA